MGKLILQVQVSVDGYIAGENGELDWVLYEWTDDIKNYVDEITKPVETILLGRNLAAGFIPHWKSVADDPTHPEHDAGILFSRTKKIVFSKSMTQSEWENTEIENGDFAARINSVKSQTRGDLIAYGGGRFVSFLIKEKLVDELHLFINPAILGKGMPIFQEVDALQKLSLVSSKQFDCGIIVLVYKPA